jgi:hypothetical protein
MKNSNVCALLITLSLTGCASTGGTDASGDDISQMVGAVMGVLLGGATTYQTGDTSQGQQVMSSVWRLMGLNEAADEVDTLTSRGASRASLLASNAPMGSSATSAAKSSTGQASSAMLQKAESTTFSFPASACPKDLQGVRSQISNPDLLQDTESFKQTFQDMAQKAGGYDVAIATIAALRVESLRSAQEANDTAQQVWGGPGKFGDPADCPQADGIYCSSIHMAWLYSDAVIVHKYTEAGLQCSQMLEARK